MLKRIRLIAPVLVLLTGAAEGATVIGLTDANALVKFDSAFPSSITSGPTPITGLADGETIRAIDYRPLTGALYAVSTEDRLFAINPATGEATLIGTFTPDLAGTEFGFDVNPAADRIRVVGETGQNLRLNPDTGALAVLDTPLNFAAGDPNFGASPTITSVAYTNNYPGATTTVLFSIDTALDILVRHSNPNAGTLATTGPLGVNTTSLTGFDIDGPTGTALAALETTAGQSRLYTVNLSTGAATLVGSIGSALRIRGIAIVPAASATIGLTTSNALIRFNANVPGTILAGPTSITGLDPSEVIVAIDYRAVNGGLYGLSSTNRLFRLDAVTGAATLVAALSSSVPGTSFGFDANPVADRIRLVSNTGQNVRVNPDNGLVIVDTPLSYAAGDPNSGVAPAVTGSAYTNSFSGAVTTVLYGIDSSLDVLVNQTNPSPNNGLLVTVGPLGVNAVGEVGFDIEPSANTAWAAILVGATSSIYSINLSTGAATLIGALGGAQQLRGLAVVLFGNTPPATFVATGVNSTQITGSFSAVAGADHYEVYRQAAGGGFVPIGNVIGLQFADTGVAAGKSYLYKVRPIGPAGNAAPDSGADLGIAMSFTEDPPIVGVTVVKALHLTEIRTAVNAARELAGLGTASFTDPSPSGVTIAATHITELRAALDPARAALGLPAVTYSRTLTPRTTLIAAVDFSEVRNGAR